MIIKTEAIAFKIVPYSRTSHIVTWFTPEFGLLTTLVKGSCRPKSHFLGQYDMFYACELILYCRAGSALHVAKECAPLRLRENIRNNWKSFMVASYFCDLIARTTPQDTPHGDIFRFIDSALDVLDKGSPRQHVIHWFELNLVDKLGLAPRLMSCASCNTNLAANRNCVTFSFSIGGIICRACCERNNVFRGASGVDGVDCIQLAPDLLAIMRSWQKPASDRYVFNTVCSASQIAALRNVTGLFLEYHLGLLPGSRKMALDAFVDYSRQMHLNIKPE